MRWKKSKSRIEMDRQSIGKYQRALSALGRISAQNIPESTYHNGIQEQITNSLPHNVVLIDFVAGKRVDSTSTPGPEDYLPPAS